MQFEVGNFVVHPGYGLGQIVKIEERQFSGKEARLYYQIALSRRTVWIPVEAEEDNGLRAVTAESELDRYRQLLTSRPVPLLKNHHRRHRELFSRLRQGSFQTVCEVARDLSAWGWHKPLGPTDMATLQKTLESLYQEWAVAAGISKTEAIKEVDSLLWTTRQAALG
ncbi:MAG: CarD family transcriptional regulator [Chloroflexota bacterium]